MKKTGAWLAVYALEQLRIRHTFGIPGVHNAELYDELNNSDYVTPILVTHEQGAAYMADAVSRVSDRVGTLVIVPAAGVTHAASGIAEAFLAGVPMLVIAAGVRTDLEYRYQLHQIDQLDLVRPFTKAAFRIQEHRTIVPTLYQAWRIATSGEPGPAFVEIPANILLFTGEVEELLIFPGPATQGAQQKSEIARAAEMLLAARQPGLFLGWGAREATGVTADIAEFLQAPVSTTLQGISVFPATHPLHTGFGFGPAAVPAARNAFADCDCLLAVGTRFGEIATGGFGAVVPEKLVHVDINPKVFGANYPAAVALEGDACTVLLALLEALNAQGRPRQANLDLQGRIRRDKQAYREQWYAMPWNGRVNPARFFDELRRRLPDDAVVAVDDGNHTYLAAELFPVHRSKTFILPTDFNSMGYAVPAAIGAKLARPGAEVVAIVGDGAFMMTCMEIVTAALNGLGIVYYVFHDGELSQIAQAQRIAYNRAPCAALGALDLEGVAKATGAAYVRMEGDGDISQAIDSAHETAKAGRPVIVDVQIDYSKRTAFTRGAVKTNFGRFPLAQKLRMAARALSRKIVG